jgi:DNA-binding CsgD family transcriptional regulator
MVLEGPAGVSTIELERLRAAGFNIVAGFEPGPMSGLAHSVRHGQVETDADAEAALLAAFAGHGLVIETRPGSPIVDRLVDDLRRLGPVDHRVVDSQHVAFDDQGDSGARAILGLLAEGLTLGQAAAQLGVSRRTADRRVAAARRALGAERTTEAVALARKAGWLPSPIDDAPGKRPAGRPIKTHDRL